MCVLIKINLTMAAVFHALLTTTKITETIICLYSEGRFVLFDKRLIFTL